MVLLDSDNATIFSVTSTVSTFLVSLTYAIPVPRFKQKIFLFRYMDLRYQS